MFHGTVAIINSLVTTIIKSLITPFVSKGKKVFVDPTLSATGSATSLVTDAFMRLKNTDMPTGMLIYTILTTSLLMNLLTMVIMHSRYDIIAKTSNLINTIRNLRFNADPFRMLWYTIIVPPVRWAKPYVLMAMNITGSFMQYRYDVLVHVLTSQELEDAGKAFERMMMAIITPLGYCVHSFTDVMWLWIFQFVAEKYYERQYLAQMRECQRWQEEARFYRTACEDGEASKNWEAHLANQKAH